ncbi:MAG TPA: hypothetical protein VIH94_03845 [Candidatus Limnocylindrales bacterium]|jgi:hypothetical protein
MWLALEDLRCAHCGAFAHPLLDACPACDDPRTARRAEAAAGPIGAVRLAEAPETLRLAQNLTLRYTIKVNSMGRSEAEATLLTAVAHLAEALTYRISGDAVLTAEDASLVLRDGTVIAQSRPSRSLVAEIPLAAIVGSASRHGEVTLHYAAGPAAAHVGSAPGSPGSAGPLRLTVSNRRALLASKARDEHYANLARWLGVLAAAAAEQRWTEVGLPAYLAELGPAAWGPAGPPSALADAIVDPGSLPAAAAPSVQARLVELESLRAAGLIAGDEYADKRREILASL